MSSDGPAVLAPTHLGGVIRHCPGNGPPRRGCDACRGGGFARAGGRPERRVPQWHLLDVLMYTCVGCAPLKAQPSPGFMQMVGWLENLT